MTDSSYEEAHTRISDALDDVIDYAIEQEGMPPLFHVHDPGDGTISVLFNDPRYETLVETYSLDEPEDKWDYE